MQPRIIQIGTFIGLVLVFPCPWYMIAVGGLLPLPVILLFGVAGGVVMVLSLVHVVIYTWVFHRVARRVGSLVRIGRVRGPVAVVLLLLTLLVLSLTPIYGSGENLAGGNKLKHDAYEVYRDTFLDLFRGGRR